MYGGNMSFDQNSYIAKYNKENYKMYQFRVKKSNAHIISKLDSVSNKNEYINELISRDSGGVLTIKQIKDIIKPILHKYGIDEVYLFGSYSRGEATCKSDVDIYCEKGNVRTLIQQGFLEEELEKALGKDIDIVFTTSQMNDYFRKQLEGDLIKLC